MKLLLLLFAFPMIGFGQNVNIPDANFKAYLVGNTDINTNGDNQIQVSEASVYNGNINCVQMNIYDLTGIEAFISLTILECYQNQLTSLDVSSCTALTTLLCEFNNLTSLDVSGCTALTTFQCHNNQLTSLDVSNCTTLTSLAFSNNQITSVDLSACTALTYLSCYQNSLTSLNVSTCTALYYLSCYNNQLTNLNVKNGNNINILFIDYFLAYNNPNLSCIEVDNVAWSTANWPNIDATASFSLNCSGAGSIQELNTNKKLLKVTDLLGRETKATNQVLIHIYDDGTLEKKIVFE